MNPTKDDIALGIQQAISGNSAELNSMKNLDYSKAMAGKISSALDTVSVDGQLTIDDDQKFIFQKMLTTLQKIAESDRSTEKERREIRNLLAELVAKNEVEGEALQQEIERYKTEIETTKADFKLEKEVKQKTIDKLEKDIEKLEKEKEIRETVIKEARQMDTGPNTKPDRSAKEVLLGNLKKDVMSDLRLVFPGVRWKQEEGESFGGMVKRTAKGVASGGVRGVADAMFGRVSPEGKSLDELVEKKKTSMSIGGIIKNLFKKPEPAAPPAAQPTFEQLDLFKGQTLAPKPIPAAGDPAQYSLFNPPKIMTAAASPAAASAASPAASAASAASVASPAASAASVASPAAPQLDLFTDQPATEGDVDLFGNPVTPSKKRKRSPRQKKYGSFHASPEQTDMFSGGEAAPVEAALKDNTKAQTEVAQKIEALTEVITKDTEQREEESSSSQLDLFGGTSAPGKGGKRKRGPGKASVGGRGAGKKVTDQLDLFGKGAAAKGGAKVAAKGLGKAALKKLPIVGAAVGLGLGVERMLAGDMLGATAEIASGAASTLPGLGTAASVAIDAGLMARDMSVADALETSAERETMPPVPPPASPSLVANLPVPQTRPQMMQPTAVPHSSIRSAENSFVRFQDKRVARI